MVCCSSNHPLAGFIAGIFCRNVIDRRLLLRNEDSNVSETGAIILAFAGAMFTSGVVLQTIARAPIIRRLLPLKPLDSELIAKSPDLGAGLYESVPSS
jgi:hypothetical protein